MKEFHAIFYIESLTGKVDFFWVCFLRVNRVKKKSTFRVILVTEEHNLSTRKYVKENYGF